ncbi:SAC3 family protein 1-like [Trifolium pratense]|uniref:SAC3 family protein 1-like n=1 Tax=Trifolium pratense TaxID=57577 RepID=A0A2K3KZK0_TRIPR|nr:SAC3 family protein 1-like [Trifolium pratense]
MLHDVFTLCTERERIQREKLRDLAVFERLNGNPAKSSQALAIKKFCRTISIKDVQASDMRPLNVLEDTLNYLLGFVDSKEHPFEVVHDFIFDRTRYMVFGLSKRTTCYGADQRNDPVKLCRVHLWGRRQPVASQMWCYDRDWDTIDCLLSSCSMGCLNPTSSSMRYLMEYLCGLILPP